MSKERKNTPSGQPGPALPMSLAALLGAVSQRHLRIKLRQFPALLVACLSIAWLLQALVDRYFRLSLEVRTWLLGFDGLVVLVLLWQYVVVPIYRRLDRRGAALLVERQMPEFDSSLISSVEFCERADNFPGHSQALVMGLLGQVAVQAKAPGIPEKVVDARPLRIRVRWGSVAAIVLLGSALLTGIHLSLLLGQRIFLSRVALPSDTQLTAVTRAFMVDAGTDARLSVTVSGVIPPAASLIVTSDGETTTVPVNLSRADGVAGYTYTVKNVRQAFTYHFVANDGDSQPALVKVNVPPTLKSIRFIQTYPDYTHLPKAVMSPGNLRFMEGSRLRIEVVSSEPLNAAQLMIKGDDRNLWFVKTDDPLTYALEQTVPDKGWKTMSVRLDAGDGRVTSNEPVYRVDLVLDRAPSAMMLLPKKDRVTVTPGSSVPLSYKASDDFGFHSVRLCYRVLRPDGQGSLTPAEQGEYQLKFDVAQKTFTSNMDFSLAKLDPAVTPGCSISCWLEVEDNNSIKHFVKTVSKEKVIAVVTEEEKRMELLELMGQRAKDVERLYDQQREVNQRAEESLHGN